MVATKAHPASFQRKQRHAAPGQERRLLYRCVDRERHSSRHSLLVFHCSSSSSLFVCPSRCRLSLIDAIQFNPTIHSFTHRQSLRETTKGIVDTRTPTVTDTYTQSNREQKTERQRQQPSGGNDKGTSFACVCVSQGHKLQSPPNRNGAPNVQSSTRQRTLALVIFFALWRQISSSQPTPPNRSCFLWPQPHPHPRPVVPCPPLVHPRHFQPTNPPTNYHHSSNNDKNTKHSHNHVQDD